MPVLKNPKHEKRQPVDWEAIHRDYLAGLLSVHEIARQHTISHTAINKRAKKEGWTRNLAPRIRKEVSARLVSEQVSAETADEIVEKAVRTQVEVVRQHRGDISKFSGIVRRLSEQLEDALENRDEITDEIELETAHDRSPQRRSRMLRAVSLGEHAGIIKDLAGSAKTLIDLERQAFGMASPISEDDPAQAAETNPLEIGRRIAFLLAQGVQAVKAGK